MEKHASLELTKIKKIVADIREFPAKIETTELAKNARQLLKKYASLSEKIERSVLISMEHQKELAKIRTAEFKDIRRKLKEKANSIIHADSNVKTKSVAKKATKTAAPKKATKTAAPKKATKTTDVKVEKAKTEKKVVKKAAPKPSKA